MLYRSFVLALALVLSPAHAQLAPTLKTVTITSPAGTPQNPFRTNRDLLGLEISTDAANGIFFAVSQGGDVSMTTFLANTTTAKLGVGLLKEGPHEITVLVSTGANVPTTQTIQVTSKPITVILDKTPPLLTITQIKLRPNGVYESFDPNRQYKTNGSAIGLKGVVSDGAFGVAPPAISISTTGTIQQATATPDASGQWELNVDISQEADGPINLDVVANDNVGGSPREGNRVEVPVGLR